MNSKDELMSYEGTQIIDNAAYFSSLKTVGVDKIGNNYQTMLTTSVAEPGVTNKPN